jgi:hypothetical protein
VAAGKNYVAAKHIARAAVLKTSLAAWVPAWLEQSAARPLAFDQDVVKVIGVTLSLSWNMTSVRELTFWLQLCPHPIAISLRVSLVTFRTYHCK